MPLNTLSVVVSALLSMSATETPVIGRAVSSAMVLRTRHGIDRGVVHCIDSDRDRSASGGVVPVVGRGTGERLSPLKSRLPV